VLIPCNYEKYKAVAKIFRSIIVEYDPNFTNMGLDEANLDVTDYLTTREMNTDKGRLSLGNEIRKRVNDATNLTCSAGIAPNKMLAKIYSDLNKPNGQAYLPP
jgi:DNA polymerase kappa